MWTDSSAGRTSADCALISSHLISSHIQTFFWVRREERNIFSPPDGQLCFLLVKKLWLKIPSDVTHNCSPRVRAAVSANKEVALPYLVVADTRHQLPTQRHPSGRRPPLALCFLLHRRMSPYVQLRHDIHVLAFRRTQ